MSSAELATTADTLQPVRPEVFPQRGQWDHFWSLTLTLTRGELKQRYFGSALGYAWTLLRPLMLFGVLYFVFAKIIFRASGAVPHFPVILLESLVLWGYFAETTSIAVTSLVARESLMRKIRFPRFAIPLSIAMTTGFHLLLNLLVVAVFIVASGVEPRTGWLLAPLLIVLLVIFTMGLSLVLSTIYVKLRDMSSIWEVLVQLLFWATPVIYVIEFPLKKSATATAIIASNPVAAVLIEMRKLVIDPSAPSVVDAMGGHAWYLCAPIGIFFAVCGFGWFIFARQAPGMAEQL
jgi:ABC-2 type transport system permease protein